MVECTETRQHPKHLVLIYMPVNQSDSTGQQQEGICDLLITQLSKYHRHSPPSSDSRGWENLNLYKPLQCRWILPQCSQTIMCIVDRGSWLLQRYAMLASFQMYRIPPSTAWNLLLLRWPRLPCLWLPSNHELLISLDSLLSMFHVLPSLQKPSNLQIKNSYKICA